MKVKSLKKPDSDKALELIREGLSNNDLIDIFGRCKVHYKGRASSQLGPGDRLTILKPDGSLLVHKEEKRTPVNWQPPDCKHSAKIKNEHLVIRSVRQNPEEIITIIFTEIHLASILNLEDPEELNLQGSEDDMGKRIMENPEIIEEEFKPVKREKKMDFGYIDIYGKDQNDNHVIIELKRRRVGPEAVSQLKRYVKEFKNTNNNNEGIRGILVSPSITESARKLLEKEELEHISVETSPEKEYGIKEKTLDSY